MIGGNNGCRQFFCSDLRDKEIEMNIEQLKQISSKLATLRNVIETMNMGLMAEGMEESVIDCMECIETYVSNLKDMVDEYIKES